MTTITQKKESPVYYTPTSDKQTNENHASAIKGHEDILKKEQDLQKARATSGAKVKENVK